MQAEVAHIDAGEVRRRLRQEHLPSMPGSGDPRRPVHVDADVILDLRKRLPRVKPHPHAHRSVGKRALRRVSSGDGVRRARERDEEGIARGIDLDTVMPRPHVAQHTVVLGEDIGVAVAELPQQPRRRLDVGEEERHRPGRELPLHLAILSLPEADDHRAPRDQPASPRPRPEDSATCVQAA